MVSEILDLLASSAVHDGTFGVESEMKKRKEEGELMLMHVHDCTLLSPPPPILFQQCKNKDRLLFIHHHGNSDLRLW